MRKLSLVLILLMGLTGCVAAQMEARNQVLRQKIIAAEIPPLPSNWQELAKTAILAQLKDPDSAKFDFSGPKEPEKWGREEYDGGPIIFGWQVTCRVNAKNSYGGYAGFTPWSVNIVEGKVFSAYPREIQTRSGHRIIY